MPLRTVNTFPPGGFRYQQKETGFKPAPMVPFQNVVNEVLDHRKGNALARATRAEVEQDIHDFNCARLGNDPRWCDNGEKKTRIRLLEFSSRLRLT